MIEALPEEEAPPASDDRRRYYRITPFGREVAAAEARRMAELLEISAKHRLLEEGEAS